MRSDQQPLPKVSKAVGALAAGGMAGIAVKASAAEPAERLDAILQRIPAENYEAAEAIGRELVAGGPPMVGAIVEAIGEVWDKKEDTAKYALHAMVGYAARPGAREERRMVAGALAKQLDRDHSREMKALIIRQLQLCGTRREIGGLAPYLGDPDLYSPAIQAVLAIGGNRAAAVIREALPAAEGDRKAMLIKAAGRLRDEKALPLIREAAKDSDAKVRRMAWYALGEIGDPESVESMLEAADGDLSYERTQATDACLNLGKRLAEKGERRKAEVVFRHLLATRKAPEDVHERCAALNAGAEALGPVMLDDLMAAMESDDLWYRNAAARTALDLARHLQKSNEAQSRRLLEKIVDSTDEMAVVQEAELLLG